MRVVIKTIQGKSIDLEIDPEENVWSVKAKLEATHAEFPSHEQKLIYKGRVLADEQLVKDAGVRENDLIVVMRIKAQAPTPFLLQLAVDGQLPEANLTFRTVAGNVAATLKWDFTAPTSKLPPAVLGAIRRGGFQCPCEPLGVQNLRVILPNGAQLDVGPRAASLADQMAA